MRDTVRVLSIGIMLIGLVIVGVVPPTKADVPVSLAPASLSLSSIPPKLPANSITYPAVVVSVVDKVGHPTVALVDVHVSLTSSQENVGKISDSVDIPAGATYAIANFTTTNTAGATIITATSIGLTTTSVSVTTVIAVGYPTHLLLSAVPSTVPARTSNTGQLIMELQDDVGLPAKAIADVSISLFSSNAHVANVTSPSVTMKQGDYLAEVDYASGFVPGSALITASASAFDSGLATVTVLGFPALALRLFAQPNLMVTCTNVVTSCAGRLVVALTDLNGNPTKAPRDLVVQVRSSNLAIVVANETTVITAGDLSAITTFSTTSAAGIARITASSPGLTSDFADVQTIAPHAANTAYCQSAKAGATPCLLKIFTGPNPVLADHQSYSSVVVAMSNGTAPIINSTGTTQITLTSSVTGVGNFTAITFPIPQGRSWASVTFTSTFQVGATQLTASSQNFLSDQLGLTTFGPVPSKVVLKPISSTLPADGGTHAVLELDLEDSQGSPAIAPFSVPVSISSSHSSIVNVNSAIIPAGQSFIVVNVTAGILEGKANVTALVSAFTTGYTTSWAILATVIPAPSSLSAFAPDSNRIISASAGQLQLVAIQLEGGQNGPARARVPMNISISSSNSTVLPKLISVSVAPGQDYVQLNITPVVPGTTTLTISTPGLSVASMSITFLPYPLVETISGGPPKIFTNQTAIISVSTMLDGAPLKGTPVHWKVSSGGLIVATPPDTNSSSISTTSAVASSSSTRSTSTATPTGLPAVDDKTDKTGLSSMIFRPSKPGSALVTAVVSPVNLPSKTFNFTVQVTAVPTGSGGKAAPSLIDQLTTFPYILAPIGGAGGAGAAAFFFIRKRGKGGGAGEEEFDNAMG